MSTNIDRANSNTSGNGKRVTYKRYHSDDNITKLKHKSSEVKWCEILDDNDADVDNKFIETFDNIYNDCIPLKKCNGNRKKEPTSPWITKVY